MATPEAQPQHLVELSQRLLDSIARGDWDTYAELCDPTLTCFEPEARGQLVRGMDFHRFYFDNLSFRSSSNITITSEDVRLLGDDVAVVCYVRLIQTLSDEGSPETARYEETRVWEKQNGVWKHVHFHRSANS